MIAWNVVRTDCAIMENDQVRVVTIHWEATDSIGEHSARVYGSVNASEQDRVFTVEAMESANMTAKAQWVKQALGDEVATYEAALAAQLEAKLNPTTMNFV